jgi:hypothetical protein
MNGEKNYKKRIKKEKRREGVDFAGTLSLDD